jgi:C4-dicarboxylate-specific signal transduction histidine kinase
MLTVLLADDDVLARKILRSALEQRGYTTVECADGTTALERLTAGRIDIAILDWHMPGLTGPEITERLTGSDQNRFIYLLLLSGRMEKQHVIEALHRGAHDVMEKPCDLTLLESRLAMASKIIKEKRCAEEMAEVMERYALQMEQLANERAQHLVHAERMSSLGVLAAGVAHEINNPMSFISGNVQCLQRYWLDLVPDLRQLAAASSAESNKVQFILEETPKLLEGIMKGVIRVTTIVKNLKRYSCRDSNSEVEPVDLNTCVRQAVELCRGSIDAGITVQLELAEQLRQVRANQIEIEQVLVNLLVNACHAMEDSAQQIMTISTREEGERAIITVSDTGSGIPPKLVSKIWDPFVTTKPQGKGTGLGLAIASGIVRKYGGSIAATNRLQGGATFEVALPTREGGVSS